MEVKKITEELKKNLQELKGQKEITDKINSGFCGCNGHVQLVTECPVHRDFDAWWKKNIIPYTN